MPGQSVEINRTPAKLTAAITASLGTTAEIDISTKCFGSVIIPAGSGITSLTWYGTETLGGTYVQIQDVSPQTVAANGGYKIPDNCWGYTALKAVGNTSGNVQVVLKG